MDIIPGLVYFVVHQIFWQFDFLFKLLPTFQFEGGQFPVNFAVLVQHKAVLFVWAQSGPEFKRLVKFSMLVFN